MPEEILMLTADFLAEMAVVTPLADLEAVTFAAREEALCAGMIAEWWDEFWHSFALTVARGNVPQIL